ncbi:HAD family hydrolase [Gimesia algae]|uniref:Phosphoglycolate phosphatase n=1 Tax=Gimesia algae TaxID=2527971 RepID=A0A517VMT9_9PLAN|nr:hypothetical protein [Gimesia algae]QDT94339.1 hypothetical protein Pan161_60350 [Gimesia algae]
MNQQGQVRWNKVIFVDWHGVLSLDPFWMSIIHNEEHPLHSSLSEAVRYLFAENDSLVRDWMRGNITTSQIVDRLQIEANPEFPPDYLARKSVDDCQLMRVNSQLIPLLQSAQQTGTAIVLATDNMDCFHDAILRARQQSPRLKETKTTSFFTTARLFDDVLCSSTQRILKSEDPRRFFEHWLSSHTLDFSDALLLDDLEKNCREFQAAGGTAIQWKSDFLEVEAGKFHSELKSWLQIS